MSLENSMLSRDHFIRIPFKFDTATLDSPKGKKKKSTIPGRLFRVKDA